MRAVRKDGSASCRGTAQEDLWGTAGHPDACRKRREEFALLVGAPANSQRHGGNRQWFTAPAASSARKPDCDVRDRQCERAGGDSLKAVFRVQSGGLRSKELPWDYGNHLHFLASLQTRGSWPGAKRRGTSLLLRKGPARFPFPGPGNEPGLSEPCK